MQTLIKRDPNRPFTEWLFRLIRRIAISTAMRLSPSERYCGVDIVDLTLDRRARALLPKVRTALQLIADLDPRRLGRLQHDTGLLVLVPLRAVAGEWWDDLGVIALDSAHVASQSAAALAMTVVHEATHARLHRMGVRYTPSLRERVERVCVEEEIEFARRIPNGGPLLEGARMKLASRWWDQRGG